jgi:hypothetical protein
LRRRGEADVLALRAAGVRLPKRWPSASAVRRWRWEAVYECVSDARWAARIRERERAEKEKRAEVDPIVRTKSGAA